MRLLVLAALFLSAHARAEAVDTYLGYTGRWVEAVATAYSPEDRRDAAYRASKGRDRYMTSGHVSDVRKVPYGVAAPLPKAVPELPAGLTIPLRTLVIVPIGYGYRDDEALRLFTVDDTGADIIANTRRTGVLHVDLRLRYEAEALAYGRRRIRLFVVTGRAPPEAPPEPPIQQRAVAGPPDETPVVEPATGFSSATYFFFVGGIGCVLLWVRRIVRT